MILLAEAMSGAAGPEVRNRNVNDEALLSMTDIAGK
jgi:hypothetical protein